MSRACTNCGYQLNRLTPGELLAIRAMAKGEGMKMAASALNLSPKTIDSHLHNARKKTKTTSVLQLILLALRSGLLGTTDLPEPSAEFMALAAASKPSAQVAEQQK